MPTKKDNGFMRVVRLEIENFLGVKAVNITPDGDVIRIEGQNGAGKSSVIDAIWAAIGGSKELPAQPIRKGEAGANIYVDLGDLRVTRKFTEKSSYLYLTDRNGEKISNPQATLDSLCSKVSMDPQEFIAKSPKARCNYLLDIIGDRETIEAIDSDHARVYAERTVNNRTVASLKGQLANAPQDDPEAKEKSVAELMLTLTDSQNKDLEAEKRRNDLEGTKNTLRNLEADKDAFETRLEQIQSDILETNRAIADEKLAIEKLDKMIAEEPESKTPAIQEEIRTADEHNQKVRDILEARDTRDALAQAESTTRGMTNDLTKLTKKKIAIIGKAKLPLKNVKIEGENLTINEIPFDDMSTSEQIKASMSLGMAFNPKLRILRISRGRELDGNSMKEVESFAKKNNCQIWIELVSDERQDGIFIKDGHVAS